MKKYPAGSTFLPTKKRNCLPDILLLVFNDRLIYLSALGADKK